MYGEWLYAKHTIFYDALPHYFMEFDILDKESGKFLSTPRRKGMLLGSVIVSVRVLTEGIMPPSMLGSLIGDSNFKTRSWRSVLRRDCNKLGFDPDRAIAETSISDKMEGLYVKVEEGGEVVGRYKFVRKGFLASVADSGSHWLRRPIIPNRLAHDE